MSSTEQLVKLILNAWPETQAIYLFGSRGTEYERPESDLDVAILLPPSRQKERVRFYSANCIKRCRWHSTGMWI